MHLRKNVDVIAQESDDGWMMYCGDSCEITQAIRRCWRFGQTNPVNVYMIASELEGAVVANLRDKERRYDLMAEAMVKHMRDLSTAAIRGGRQVVSEYNPMMKMELPTWLSA